MRNLEKRFVNKKMDYNKLLEYGFTCKDNTYSYSIEISDGFKVIIELSNNRKISKVIDEVSNEEYILVDIEGSNGEFVGKIKEKYEYILDDIIKKCTTIDIYKSNQTKKVIKYINEKYGNELEYLWDKFPNFSVVRNSNNKWYIVFMVVEEKKLNINSENIVEIIDLRYDKDDIINIVDNKSIFRGYHMNKNSWITIKLDGSIEIDKIYKLVDNSYNLSLK